MKKSLLQNREDVERIKRSYKKRPITLELEREEQKLFYFGANHSRDPNNFQYKELKKYWERFLKETGKTSKAVLLEGTPSKTSENEESAIKEGAESSFVILLSKSVPAECADLSLEEGVKELKGFSYDEALLYDFLVFVDNYQRLKDPKPKFKEEVKKWQNHRKKKEPWEDMDLSLDNLKRVYKEIIKKDFTETESQNFFINPNKKGTRINEFARSYSDLRDVHIVSQIERHLKEGRSVFAVFGTEHLIIQKPALEILFN